MLLVMTTKSILTPMTRYCLIFLVLMHLFPDVKADEASNVVSPMEAYWHSNLPNTSMPEIIRNLIHPGQEEKFVWEEYLVVWKTKKVSIDVLSIFFQPKDIYPGAKIKKAISLDRTVIGNAFIPRIKAEAIPFSSKNLSQILNHYSISPGSKEAKQIEQSLSDCESPASKGAKKFCATSLETMIDNVISELGTQNLQVMSTIQLVKRGAKREKVFYKIASLIKELSQEKLVLCHPLPSPQAVFFCHTTPTFKGYAISLEGDNGTKVNALAICHYDTKDFNPVFLEMLNVKPDTKPICHFLMEDHLVWAPHS